MNIDKPGEAFGIDTEIQILEEAMRLVKAGELPKQTWNTWDSFAGRTVEHTETDENWTRRIIRMAIQNILHSNPA